jgi:CubicO group peptidase (beta-lactamase class C family)
MSDPRDTKLREAVATGALACVAAMAADSSGVIHEAAFGIRDPATGEAMTTDSLAWIASMTKAIVSVAALRLAERGLLSLDGPISDVIPELAAPKVLDGFAEDGTPRFRPAARAITLRHLLTHTAGFGYDTWNAELVVLGTRHGFRRIPADVSGIAQAPLLFDPGERFNYGINIDMVGHAIERVTGQRLDAHLRETILAPLGLHDTDFVPGPDQLRRRAVLRARNASGTLDVLPGAPAQTMPFMAGGGGLYSTASDYLRFLREILAGAPNLLRAETMRLLETNQIGDIAVPPMRTQAPHGSNDVHLYPGMTLRWSLGFLLNEQTTPEGRAPGSMAWAGLPNCYYWIDRTSGVCGVFITALLPFCDPAAVATFQGWEASVYRALLTP